MATASCQPLLDEAIACGTLYPADPEKTPDGEFFLLGLFAQRATNVNKDDYGGSTTVAIHVAIDEINSERGVEVSGRRLKLLLVECNETPTTEAESMDMNRAYLAARVDHLVQKLQIPAILGPSTTGATRIILRDDLADSTALLLSPSATERRLTQNTRPGSDRQLFWRTVPPDPRQIPALSAALGIVRDLLRKNLSTDPEIFSIYDTSNDANIDLQNLLSRAAVQDGLGSPMSRSYSSATASTREQVLSDLVKDKTKPRIIVPFTTGDFVANMLPAIEKEFESSSSKPWYVMSEGNRASFAAAIAAVNNSDLPARVIGTAPGPRLLTDTYAQFLDSYRRANTDNPTPGNLAEFAYDAAYLLAFAINKAAAKQWPDGPALAKAIGELSCTEQPKIELEAARLSYGSQSSGIAHAPDGCFNLNGASGPLDYEDLEMTTGNFVAQELDDASSDIAFWCLGKPKDPKDQTANLKYYFKQTDGIVADRPDDPPLTLSGQAWCSNLVRQ